MTSGQVVLAGLGLSVASVLGMAVVPPTDGGVWLTVTAAVGLFGTPFAYILARGLESDRDVREAVERFGRDRGFRVTAPPELDTLPEQCVFRRQRFAVRPFSGVAVETIRNGRRLILTLGRYQTADDTVDTLPTLVIPGGLPASPDWRIAPLGLLHGEGVPTGDRAFAENYRLDSTDASGAKRCATRAVRKVVAAEPGWTVEVVDGAVIAWREPQTTDALRNAATPPARLIPGQLERLLALADALTAGAKDGA